MKEVAGALEKAAEDFKEAETTREAAENKEAAYGRKEAETPKEGQRKNAPGKGLGEDFFDAKSEARESKSDESRGRPKKEEGSIPEMTLQLMVTMMEAMKEMQKKTNEGREDSGMLRAVELVRAGVTDLPALPPWSPTTGPLQLGDWMPLITPNLSLTSEELVEFDDKGVGEVVPSAHGFGTD